MIEERNEENMCERDGKIEKEEEGKKRLMIEERNGEKMCKRDGKLKEEERRSE